MECNLVHIVPFDIGMSFSNYEDIKRYSKDQFIKKLMAILPEGYVLETDDHDYLCVIKLTNKIECRIFEYGVGVFIIKNLTQAHNNKAEQAFEKHPACKSYFEKKAEQKELLINESGNISDEVYPIFDLMEKIWSIKKIHIRPYSSCSEYKYHGLSYVLTIYHIVDERIVLDENKQIDLLMNPSVMNDILKEDRWEGIKTCSQQHIPVGYKEEVYNEGSSVIASWSAVAVVEKKASAAIDSIIRYEVSLQSAWFLFDALVDNLENVKLSNLDLQRCKSTATNVFLGVNSILGANMSTSEKMQWKLFMKHLD